MFFPPASDGFSHTCFDQYSTKYLSVTFCRFCSPLSAPLFSLVLCPPISSCLGPPILSALSLHLRKTTRFCLGSTSCTTAWWVGGNHRFHLISFPLSGIIILYCLISSDLNRVVSYILSGSLIVSGRNINLVYLALSWLEVEICLFHFKMKKSCQDWEFRASLVAQWLRICLPIQGTRVWALVWEDLTCRGATRPVSHNYWACASGACAPQQERPRQWEARAPRWRVALTHRN